MEIKEEPNEQNVGDQDSDALREEYKEAGVSFHLMTLRTPLAQSVLLMSLEGSSRNARKLRDLLYHVNPEKEPQLQMWLGKIMDHMHLRGQEDIEVDQCHLTHSCSTQPCMDRA